MSSEPKQPDWAAHVDVVSASIGLPIDPAWRQSVIDNLARIGLVAQAFMTFPLDDHAEPAPEFEP